MQFIRQDRSTNVTQSLQPWRPMLPILFDIHLAAIGNTNLVVTPNALQTSANKIQSMAIAKLTLRDGFSISVRNSRQFIGSLNIQGFISVILPATGANEIAMSEVIFLQAICDSARDHYEVDGVRRKPCENACVY